ncbi:hypothetical protein Hdeb2414_s0004g00130551 [Helianthus debilis subsp. tardiflorus]
MQWLWASSAKGSGGQTAESRLCHRHPRPSDRPRHHVVWPKRRGHIHHQTCTPSDPPRSSTKKTWS